MKILNSQSQPRYYVVYLVLFDDETGPEIIQTWIEYSEAEARQTATEALSDIAADLRDRVGDYSAALSKLGVGIKPVPMEVV